jgi:hypothetical protein
VSGAGTAHGARRWLQLFRGRSDAENKRHHKQHEENEEEYFGNVSCSGRDSTKPENRGDDRDKKEYDSPSQHGILLLFVFALLSANVL